jgi:hypothetical protein
MAEFRLALLALVALVLSSCAPPGGGREYRQPDPASFERVEGRLTLGGTDETVQGANVSQTFFTSASAVAYLGRLLIDGDFTSGRPVVVLHHGLWQARFDGSPTAIGRAVQIDGEPRTVVGVTPPDFDIPEGVRYWVPR